MHRFSLNTRSSRRCRLLTAAAFLVSSPAATAQSPLPNAPLPVAPLPVASTPITSTSAFVLAQDGGAAQPAPDALQSPGTIPTPTLPRTEVLAEDDAPPAQPAPPADEPPSTPGGPSFERALESGGNESVITSERIEQNVARGLGDIFRYEPGVQVQSSTGRFGDTSINIRGLEGNRVLMSIDGVRSPDAFLQGPIQLGRASVDPSLLKQVEIVRGPGSLIYGEGAIGGVVAFETKDPDDFLDLLGRDSYFGVSGSYFSADSSWAETPIVALRTGNLDAMVAYTRRDGSELETAGAFHADPQQYQSDYILGKLVYHFDPDSELDFSVEWQNRQIGTNLRSTLADPPGSFNTFVTTPEVFPGALPGSRFSSIADDENRRIRYSLTHDYDNPCGGLFAHVRLQIYYQDAQINDARLQQFLVPAVVAPFVPNRHQIDDTSNNFFTQDHFGGRAIVRGEFDNGVVRHKLVYGVDALRTDTGRLRDGIIVNQATGTTVNSGQVSDPTPVKVLPDVTTTRVGLFFRDRIETDALPFAITPGVRVNYYSAEFALPDPLFDASGGTPENVSEWNAQPLVELSVPITEQLESIVRYARGYRGPPIEDAGIGFTNPLFGYVILPNVDLTSETSDSIDVGLSYSGELVAAYAGGYYNHYDGFIENVSLGLNPNTGLIEFQQRNLDAQIYGVEMSAEVRLFGQLCESSPRGGTGSAQGGTGSASAGRLCDGCGFGDADAALPKEFYGWSAFGNFTHSVGQNLEDDVPLDSIPPMYAIAGLRYRAMENRWGVEFVSTMVHRKDRYSGADPNQFITPGYGVFDLLAYANVSKNVQVNVGLFNLSNREYYQWLNLRGIEANDADRTRFAAPGINAAATLKVQW
ncbi:MAG: TonB-dependent hemoglobin/transferrin/lactoferrin family receptor [Pirellulales bacterium]